jgi:hypothetical protein
MNAHFHGGPWAGKCVDLPMAWPAVDIQRVPGSLVRYRLARWEGTQPHYDVDGVRSSGSELVFPLPLNFPDSRR